MENSEQNEWVTIGRAAELLTQSGDPIDRSNVSRYLKRFPEIPSRKEGRCRYVDIAALFDHRNHNVMVAEKRGSRGVSSTPARQASAPARPRPRVVMPEPDLLTPDVSADVGEESEPALSPGNPLQEANLTIKRLQIHTMELDQAERESKLVPSDDVLAIASGAMAAFVRALEHGETEVTQEFGREVGAAFRKTRKRAQSQAARELIAVAKKFLPPEQVAAMIGADLG